MEGEPENETRSSFYDNWAVREVDHLLTRFTRYTRFVVFSKWFLAVVAVVLLVVLVIYPILRDRAGTRLSFITTDVPAVKTISPSQAPSMAHPVYEGTNIKGEPYRITGDTATQQTTDLIIIDKVVGTLQTPDSLVTLTADKAEYYQTEKRIELTGNVHVINGKGYDFVTPQATIDTNTMIVTGKQEISGTGPMGKLLATGFEIRDNGKTINFGGTSRVNVTIDKGQKP